MAAISASVSRAASTEAASGGCIALPRKSLGSPNSPVLTCQIELVSVTQILIHALCSNHTCSFGIHGCDPSVCVNSTAACVDSTAEGVDSTAEGVDSTAEGVDSTAEGVDSTAEGVDSTAACVDCTAEGVDSTAEGVDSTAEGVDSTAACVVMSLSQPIQIRNIQHYTFTSPLSRYYT
jgi:hypothetical protein